MYFDRFDIVEAHYVFCMRYHQGQWSERYARLCKISRYFKPGLSVDQGRFSSDNAREIYKNLVREEKKLERIKAKKLRNV